MKAKKIKDRKEDAIELDAGDILVTHPRELTHARSLPTQMPMSSDDIGFDSSLLPPPLLQMVIKYNYILDTIYPLENTVDPRSRWTDNLLLVYRDRKILTGICMAMSAVTDITLNSRLSSGTQQILCNMLSTLNQGLHQAVKQQSAKTVLTILILLFIAEGLQDFDAIGTHLEGVGRLLIIEDRVPTGWDAKLLFKIQQFDLRLALATGRPLRLALEYPFNTVPTIGTSGILEKLEVSSLKVVGAFQNLQALTQHVTESMRLRTSLIWEDVQPQVSTIQTQLLGLEENDLSDMEEALRLGILGFLTTLSLSPIRRLHLPRFCSQLEMSYMMQCNNKAFGIWLVMMGLFSTVEVTDPVVGDLWMRMVDAGLSWPDARKTMVDEQLPWIGFIHDEPAKKMFDCLQASRRPTESFQ
ncbi:uncharacterized protein FIESC28_03803 [Fusarium coffeatum]|uniref:Uncharacterized protein n=1 Tax=Fusarium coffeatum TaxID=231269 RepID=A0A366S295_9HYPO|nr:uncharacterized protein FIESC28_03803 [Fusarium coffeatum]RBR23424.1 hypothetical protein FIESC28_03803 [Fusarium coffeatum]